MGRLLVKTRLYPDCVQPGTIFDEEWCTEKYVDWCADCPGPQTMEWRRWKPMRKFGPREVQFNFALDTLASKLTDVQVHAGDKQFTEAREALLEIMLSAGNLINMVDVVAGERARSDKQGE